MLVTLFALDWLTQIGPHFGSPPPYARGYAHTIYSRAALVCRRADELAARLAERPGLAVYLIGTDGVETSEREPTAARSRPWSSAPA